MRLIIDIPDRMYDAVKDGTYCGSLYNELKNGTPLPKGHGFIAICDSDEKLSEQAIHELKNTVFVGDEKCPYCFDIADILEADREGEE